jgi:serine/threonine-protein kinase
MIQPTACPDPALWQGLLHGTLSAAEEAALSGHLDVCAGCRQTLDALTGGKAWAGAPRPAPGEAAPPNAASRQDTLAEPVAGDDQLLDFLDPPEQPGQLGRFHAYEVLAVLGRGGTGVVLKAFDPALHRLVAIKVLAPRLATYPAARKRIAREAQAAAAVRHAHIVAIHAVDTAGRLPYLVMQYVAGISLQERLERAGPLELREVLRVGMQTASGLAAAHAQGLIHRDVKPANILLVDGLEQVKLTDFGLARAVDDATLTQSGVLTGTPQYMSPEQARGEKVDHRTDLFSLGSVLYTLCTGRPPFCGETNLGVLQQVCDETPPPIRAMNPEVPPWLVEIIDQLLAKDRARRFQSAAEVADLLGQHLAHLEQPAAVPMPPRLEQPALPRVLGRLRVRGRVTAGVALLFLLGGLCLSEVTGLTCLTERLAAAIAGLAPAELGKGLPPRTAPAGPRTESPPVELPHASLERFPTAPAVPAGPFVVLAPEGKTERGFDTLAGAVAEAGKGDVIEVRGNGPFVSEPITIAAKPLTIRAAKSFRPVLQLNPTRVQPRSLVLLTDKSGIDAPLVRTNAPLVLEGLDLQRLDQGEKLIRAILLSWQAPLYVANCRFLMKPPCQGVLLMESPRCEVRNCQFLDPGNLNAVDWQCAASGQLVLDNNLVAGADAAGLLFHNLHPDPVSVRLTRNTFAVGKATALCLHRVPPTTSGNAAPPPIRMETVANIFDGQLAALQVRTGAWSTGLQARGQVLQLQEVGGVFAAVAAGPVQALPMVSWQTDRRRDRLTTTAEALLPCLLQWHDQRNLYPAGNDLWGFAPEKNPPGATRARRTLTAWTQLWRAEKSASRQGRIKYQGGDVLSRVAVAPEQVSPADFRLHPDSAGYRADTSGGDLGILVNLVGPGPAYERWQQTPDYQQWLRATGQLMTERRDPSGPRPAP